MTDHRVFYRRSLPHWQPAGATLFTTFRLAGSLPAGRLAELREESEQEEPTKSQFRDTQGRRGQTYRDAKRAFRRWDAALDGSDSGPQWLTDPRVAAVILEALHHRHGRVYELLAFCIMPNHVHLVCAPLQRKDGTYHVLHRILQSLKRHTARQANVILGRQGTFWQAESYDHVVRDPGELTRIIGYVINNPVKAGLVSSWEARPWTYVKE